MKTFRRFAWNTSSTVVRTLVVIFCLGPVLLILGLSLFRDVFDSFPPKHLSLDLWHELAASEKWRDAIFDSLSIAVPSSILTVLIVVPAVIALQRGRVRGRGLVEGLAIAPMLIPVTAYVLSLYIVFLDFRLVGAWWAIVLVESAISVPVVFIVLQQGAAQLDGRLEFAAMSLGASRLRAEMEMAMALLRPAMIAAFLFSFLVAFDDAVYVTFLSGPELTTTSQAIFSSLRFSVDPLIAPLSAVLMIFVLVFAFTGVGLQTLFARRLSGGNK